MNFSGFIGAVFSDIFNGFCWVFFLVVFGWVFSEFVSLVFYGYLLMIEMGTKKKLLLKYFIILKIED